MTIPNATNTSDVPNDLQARTTKAFDDAKAAGQAEAEAVRRRRPRKGDTREDVDAEMRALQQIVGALEAIDTVARNRVLLYLARRYTADGGVDAADGGTQG